MSRTDHAACSCVSLADNEVGAIALCPQCGVVTMRLQYISLRFETEAFERVAALVEQAQMRLGGGFRAMVRDASDNEDSTQKPH